MTSMIDITPKPSLLHAVRNQGLSWNTCLCELIDNAFDADASEVELVFGPDTVEIHDNGQGCADLVKMLTLGDRQDHGSTLLGRYGIGLKDAAISLGDTIVIISRQEGTERKLSCNWKQLERRARWEIAGPNITPTTTANGTSISIQGNLKKRKSLPDIIEKLGLTYLPALQAGKHIRWRFMREPGLKLVTPFAFPRLEHQRTETLVVDGKTATVTMGLLVPDQAGVQPDKCLGLMLIYGYRVIAMNERFGLGHAPTPRLFGTITFSRDWELTKNKSGLVEAQEALAVQIERRFADVIALAVQQGVKLPFYKAQRELNQILDSLYQFFDRRKAKRAAPRNHTGTVKPRGTGSPHRQAERVQPGTRFPVAVPGHGLQIGFMSLKNDKLYQLSGNVIYFNEDSPTIQALRHNDLAIKMCAISPVAFQLVSLRNIPQMTLPGLADALEEYETIRDKVEYCERIMLELIVHPPQAASAEAQKGTA